MKADLNFGDTKHLPGGFSGCRRLSRAACFLGVLFASIMLVAGDAFVQTKLTASDGKDGDLFGKSIAVSSDGLVVVVGAPNAGGKTGTVYVFELTKGTWTESKLNESKPAAGDLFGTSVAIDGATIVIGAPGAGGAGKAYVFVKPRGGNWPKTETAELVSSAPVVGDKLGFSVSISQDTIVVGAQKASGGKGLVNGGKVFVFPPPAGGWGAVAAPVTETAQLTQRLSAEEDTLGASVSISKNVIMAGNPTWGRGSGMVDVYLQPAKGGWVSTSETSRLGGCGKCRFGTSVSLNGSTAVVGAYYAKTKDPKNPKKNLNTGAAYIFVGPWPDQGAFKFYQPTAELTASNRKQDDFFGASVSTNGSLVLVGAPRGTLPVTKTGKTTGSTYFFTQKAGKWKDMTEDSELTPDDQANENLFGWSVSLSSDGATMLVGAPGAPTGKDVKLRQGAAYVFTKKKNQNLVRIRLESLTMPSDGAAGVTYVALSGSEFPEGNIDPTRVVIGLSTECHGFNLASTSAASIVSGDGDSKLMSFLLPSGLESGQYYISVSDYSDGDANSRAVTAR